MNDINTDALAEAEHRRTDPQFQDADDLIDDDEYFDMLSAVYERLDDCLEILTRIRGRLPVGFYKRLASKIEGVQSLLEREM